MDVAKPPHINTEWKDATMSQSTKTQVEERVTRDLLVVVRSQTG